MPDAAPFSCEMVDTRLGWGGNAVIIGASLRLDLRALGRRIAIVGRTGAGKTTLLHALAGQTRPLGGEIRWHLPDGRTIRLDARGRERQTARRIFSFVFQDAALVPHLTVAENLALPLATLPGPWQGERRTARQERLDALLQTVLIAGEEAMALAHRFPDQLSGGQRQRVALAQALAANPTVLFADEPTGNLDPETRDEMRLVLARWFGSGPTRALIWVTHHREPCEFENTSAVLSLEAGPDGNTRLTLRPVADYRGSRAKVARPVSSPATLPLASPAKVAP